MEYTGGCYHAIDTAGLHYYGCDQFFYDLDLSLRLRSSFMASINFHGFDLFLSNGLDFCLYICLQGLGFPSNRNIPLPGELEGTARARDMCLIRVLCHGLLT